MYSLAQRKIYFNLVLGGGRRNYYGPVVLAHEDGTAVKALLEFVPWYFETALVFHVIHSETGPRIKLTSDKQAARPVTHCISSIIASSLSLYMINQNFEGS